METTNTTMSEQPRSGLRKFWLIRKIIILIIILAVAVCWFWGQQIWIKMTAKGYQAVFLSNGQVYFGKISATNKWIKLTDVYYLQQSGQNLQADNTQVNAQQQPQLSLIKLGKELHGPEDAMYIEKDKVLFWENMKDDSQVVAKIKEAQSK